MILIWLELIWDYLRIICHLWFWPFFWGYLDYLWVISTYLGCVRLLEEYLSFLLRWSATAATQPAPAPATPPPVPTTPPLAKMAICAHIFFRINQPGLDDRCYGGGQQAACWLSMVRRRTALGVGCSGRWGSVGLWTGESSGGVDGGGKSATIALSRDRSVSSINTWRSHDSHHLQFGAVKQSVQ